MQHAELCAARRDLREQLTRAKTLLAVAISDTLAGTCRDIAGIVAEYALEDMFCIVAPSPRVPCVLCVGEGEWWSAGDDARLWSTRFSSAVVLSPFPGGTTDQMCSMGEGAVLVLRSLGLLLACDIVSPLGEIVCRWQVDLPNFVWSPAEAQLMVSPQGQLELVVPRRGGATSVLQLVFMSPLTGEWLRTVDIAVVAEMIGTIEPIDGDFLLIAWTEYFTWLTHEVAIFSRASLGIVAKWQAPSGFGLALVVPHLSIATFVCFGGDADASKLVDCDIMTGKILRTRRWSLTESCPLHAGVQFALGSVHGNNLVAGGRWVFYL